MQAIRTAIELHWRRVYHFAFRVCLDRDEARRLTEETYLRAYIGAHKMPVGKLAEAWLLRIATHVCERGHREPDVSFELLDETLRSEATRTDVVQSLSDPQRNFYLWELKQGCMTSVVNCLPPGERVAFVLHAILGYGEEDTATILGITPSAVKVRLSRGRKKVTDYLAPRCEHVDPRNPCRCPSRLGVALAREFIPRTEVRLRPSFGRYGPSEAQDDVPLRDVMAIYQSLPEPEPPGDLPAWLFSQLDSGAWAERASAR